MATVSKIGSAGAGRDYSTIASWLASFAAGGWEGQCYNDSEFVITGSISFSGHSTSATNYIKLTTATGQSFRDNASASSNPLRYDASKGVGIRCTTGYTIVFNVAETDITITTLQAQGQNDVVYENNQNATTRCVVDSCILEGVSTTSGNGVARNRSGKFTNCLLINRGTAGMGVDFSYPSNSPSAINCTIVRPSDKTAAGSGLVAASSGATVKNTAVFGFTNFQNTAGNFSGSNNCSDKAIGFGTSNQATKTYASQFVTTTDSARDFRAKAAADLLENAVTDTTDIPGAVDIIRTARPQGTAWDIGCWELAASGSIYSVSASESASAGDSPSDLATLIAAILESLSGADSPSSLATLGASGAEPATGADSPSSIATLPAATAEPASGGDAPASSGTLPGASSESSTAADTDAAQLVGASSAAEAASSADTPSSIATLPATATEAGSGADTVSLGGGISVSGSDTSTATDTDASALSSADASAEAAPITDTVSDIATLGATGAENASGADSSSSVATLPGAATEAASALSTQSSAATLTATGLETASAGDGTASLAVYPSTATDNSTPSDTASNGNIFSGGSTDTGSASDAASSIAALGAAIAEAATATSATVSVHIASAAAAETLAAADAATSSAALAVLSAEIASAIDAAIVGGTFGVEIIDVNVLVDVISQDGELILVCDFRYLVRIPQGEFVMKDCREFTVKIPARDYIARVAA